MFKYIYKAVSIFCPVTYFFSRLLSVVSRTIETISCNKRTVNHCKKRYFR